MKKEASLSIVEDVDNHKFLMIRHHRGINKGCMNFPGGKKEPDETMRDCVIRETFEETGFWKIITAQAPQPIIWEELKDFAGKKNSRLLIWLKISLLSCLNMKLPVKNQAMANVRILLSDKP